nr:hypothetical protein CFP56_58178 [Quercus suber]
MSDLGCVQHRYRIRFNGGSAFLAHGSVDLGVPYWLFELGLHSYLYPCFVCSVFTIPSSNSDLYDDRIVRSASQLSQHFAKVFASSSRRMPECLERVDILFDYTPITKLSSCDGSVATLSHQTSENKRSEQNWTAFGNSRQ